VFKVWSVFGRQVFPGFYQTGALLILVGGCVQEYPYGLVLKQNEFCSTKRKFELNKQHNNQLIYNSLNA